MKTTMKKISAMIMTLVLVCGLAIPAFAVANADTDTITVTIKVQTQDTTGITPVTEEMGEWEVEINSGMTVYDAVNQAAEELADEDDAPLKNAVWKDVPLTGSDGTGKALVYLESSKETAAGLLVTTMGNHSENETKANNTHGSYSGTAWEYQVGTESPYVYMDAYELTADAVVTLSYTTSSFTW